MEPPLSHEARWLGSQGTIVSAEKQCSSRGRRCGGGSERWKVPAATEISNSRPCRVDAWLGGVGKRARVVKELRLWVIWGRWLESSEFGGQVAEVLSRSMQEYGYTRGRHTSLARNYIPMPPWSTHLLHYRCLWQQNNDDPLDLYLSSSLHPGADFNDIRSLSKKQDEVIQWMQNKIQW